MVAFLRIVDMGVAEMKWWIVAAIGILLGVYLHSGIVLGAALRCPSVDRGNWVEITPGSGWWVLVLSDDIRPEAP